MTLHIVNGFLFACALYVHVRGYRDITLSDKPNVIKRLGHYIVAAGACLTALFVFLQADWIVSNHNSAVGDGTSWAWLLFDYGLAVYLLLMGTLMRVLAQWRGGVETMA